MVPTSPENGNELPMSIENPEGNENCPPDSASIDEKLNYLLDVVEDQQETIRQQQEQIEGLREEVEQLQADEDDPDSDDEVEEQEDLREEIEQLRKILYSSIEHRKELHKEVENLRANGGNSSPRDEEKTTLEPQTPLEDMVTAPEHLLDHDNPKRARFIAKDIKRYSHSVPAGRAIKAGEIRQVLSAREDGHVHTGTVDRVIPILDEMGKDEVEVGRVPDGNERVVVFSEECVARIERLQTDHTVVIEEQEEAGEPA